jgi:hypothetical protein
MYFTMALYDVVTIRTSFYDNGISVVTMIIVRPLNYCGKIFCF